MRALDPRHPAVHGLLIIVEQDWSLKEHDHHLVEWPLGPLAMPPSSGLGEEYATVLRLQSTRGIKRCLEHQAVARGPDDCRDRGRSRISPVPLRRAPKPNHGPP